MPERFLLQVLRSLVRHDLLRSTRGVDGGYYLSRPAEQISLRDIVEAFGGPLQTAVPAIEGIADSTRTMLMATLRNVADAGSVTVWLGPALTVGAWLAALTTMEMSFVVDSALSVAVNRRI